MIIDGMSTHSVLCSTQLHEENCMSLERTYDSQITVFMWSRQKVKVFTVEIKSTLTYNVGTDNYIFVFHSTAKEGNNTFVVKTRFKPK